ncbi:FYVE, RhoGEF and PH domain-containing protein 5-like isoform X2 [Denticeps clupeoides]|uniref:FYVE, RhoGEF and PH domain-containing protein 5-like isoform X2 n=2 Tax=Denticeps clupeoides TaxID=299321 RepID=UPI0010A47D87|nr:FYVE, RhoGEF and PH domain-containing protein 5-like isoform X2 [Denticeps clupeoides]
MSRPCAPSQGPKPPVAPKPRLPPELEDEHRRSRLGNGGSGMDLEQEDESEAIDESDEHCLSEEDVNNHPELHHDEVLERDEEDDEEGKSDGADCLTLAEDCDDADGTDSGQFLKGSDHEKTSGEPAESVCGETSSETGEGDDKQSVNRHGSNSEEADGGTGDAMQEPNGGDISSSLSRPSPSSRCSQHGPATWNEEYPYDVIGPQDDTSTWQPERATKDPSGRYRFSDMMDDMFEPYSVIEVVPADLEETADPDIMESDDEEPNASDEQVTVGTSNPEGGVEEVLAHDNPDDQQPQDGGETATESDAANDYADIDDGFCRDEDDMRHLECPSSEDYVEIGDEDDQLSINMEWKSKGQSTGKQDQGVQSLRSSCQPRLRLCNITVPVDLDLGRTPELTNRVVFAHTTEAFEEDIEDLDCHIVPFFEDSDTESEEHIYEEAGLDSEGENFISLDRKSIVTRSRSLSGKVPGYVPETVPEETHEYYTVALDQNGDPLKHSEAPEVNRMIPTLKPRRFLLYPRSYSVEGRDPMAAQREGDHSPKDEDRLKRKDDTLSLPCVITSSGSFSQRSHQSSSGVSTPTSLVDIPPPFELAYITKRPVTKSSPSLLIQHESTEKPKKKKTSFKRFLALKFRRKNENKSHGDGSVRSSRSSSESSHHGPTRVLELDHRSTSSSPQLQTRIGNQPWTPELPAPFELYKDRQTRKGVPKTYGSRRVSRVESFEDRSRPPFMPLPLTKPRSISFPSADTSDYENIPAMSSDYENIQIPTGRPTRAVTITEFFDDPARTIAPANENDGYVDMNSLAGIENKSQPSEQEAESAYTEPFPVCPASTSFSAEEDHGRTSEEEDGCADHSFDRQIDGRSRAFYVAKELVDSEREHVKALKHLEEDFRTAVVAAAGEDGDPVLQEERLEEILGLLPHIYQLHCSLLSELDDRIRQWEESPRVVDAILTRRAEFAAFVAYISEYDHRMALLDESCSQRPAFSDIAKQFENAEGVAVPLKHQLLQVIVRVLQYRMLLTDYLNNLSPDSREYEDTQAALVIVTEVADQTNDSLKQGENLLRLVHIEYSIRGRRALLQPGRVFVKEGTLMKVSRKSKQPRHLFLMNDVMLYTYPQQDGKYRLKNTLSLRGMKISKPVVDNVLNTLRIEVSDVTITLSASSCGEREDWFHTLSRAIADHAAGLNTFSSSSEAREKLWMSLGEAAPILVPVSHVMMCMNCTADFSLTLRRHHCNACGKVVCRSCSRNRYPLKYLKDRMAKVCDHCYSKLRKRGGNMPRPCGNASPRSNRASRPLSAVFQNFQPPSLWRSRKSTSPLAQVSVGAEGSTLSGSLLRRKKSKKKWKRLWFLLKDKVLYTFKAREDKVASETLPLQGFTVKLSDTSEGDEASGVFQLYHKKTLYYTFKADDKHSARRWVNAMEEATVL